MAVGTCKTLIAIKDKIQPNESATIASLAMIFLFLTGNFKNGGKLNKTNTNKTTVSVSIVNCVMAKSGAL
ncbi:hypothetical protein D9M68_972130 [compost metagenome]